MKRNKISILVSTLLLSGAFTFANAAAECVGSGGSECDIYLAANGYKSELDSGYDIYNNGTYTYFKGYNTNTSFAAGFASSVDITNYSTLHRFAPLGNNLINYGTLHVYLYDDDGELKTAQHVFDTAGSITFKSGSNLFIDVNSDATGNYNGQTISNVIMADGGIIIEDEKLIIEDNSALLDFSYKTDINGWALDLLVSQEKTVQSTIASDNKNAGQAATVLQNIRDNLSKYSQMNEVNNALNGLSTDKQVADAVDSTTPQTTTSSFTASNQISNNVSNIVSQRQNVNLNGSGLNSGDEMLSEKNVWVKPYGSFGSQEDKAGVNGFDIDTYGIGLGVDGEYADNQKIGVGFFYTNANVDVNNVSQTSDIDVYSLIVYGNLPIIDDKTNLLYQLGYSLQETSSQRDIAFMSTTAESDYTSHVASADVKLLRDYQINDDVLLQPFVSTTYRYFNSPSYSENGAGALNLDVKSFSSSEFILGVGTLGYYRLDESSKLFGNVNVGYDLKDDSNIVSSSYQGASGLSFETKGIDNGRWNYDLGLGVENDITELSNLSFSYNFQGEGSDYTNHVISAKYTFKF
jgi:outer membrane autotransporter protein